MTPVDRAVLFLFVLAFLFVIYQSFLGSIRCSYCGEIAGHDDHCPYGGSGL